MIFGGLKAANASPSGNGQISTVNQGAAGTSAWPVTGIVSVANLPTTQQVAGTVKVATPTPYFSTCFAAPDLDAASCTTSATTSDVVVENVSVTVTDISGHQQRCAVSDSTTGDFEYVPLIASPGNTVDPSNHDWEGVGNSVVHMIVKNGDSITGSCDPPSLGARWTFSGVQVTS
jgi:hypothetical protein